MNNAQKVVCTFNPNRPIRQVANFIRAQVAGKGVEKSFVLKTLEARAKFDESGLGLALPIETIIHPTAVTEVVAALVYLDGSGYGDYSLNQLLVAVKMFPVEGPAAYSLD
jgi:hypothetical protein